MHRHSKFSTWMTDTSTTVKVTHKSTYLHMCQLCDASVLQIQQLAKSQQLSWTRGKDVTFGVLTLYCKHLLS